MVLGKILGYKAYKHQNESYPPPHGYAPPAPPAPLGTAPFQGYGYAGHGCYGRRAHRYARREAELNALYGSRSYAGPQDPYWNQPDPRVNDMRANNSYRDGPPMNQSQYFGQQQQQQQPPAASQPAAPPSYAPPPGPPPSFAHSQDYQQYRSNPDEKR